MRRCCLLFAFSLSFVGSVTAADLYPADSAPPTIERAEFESRWQVSAAVYLWAPSLNGTVGVGGSTPIEIDASFSDLLDYLDFAFMAVAEARYDRFGIFADLMYTKLSDSGTGPGGVITASVTQQMTVGTLMGEYRVIEQGRSSVDLMAGARIWGLDADVDITGGGGGVSGSGDKWWVDPMIGVKARAQGASPWYATGWAMIGGFGVSSNIDWDLFGGVGYEVNDRFALVGGYRGVGVDYSDGGFVFDIIQHGPVFGGVFRF
jgi:hypothetical protein